MKISKIKITNLFGIKEQELGGKSVELTGENGVGKSSVIDAIRYALTNKSDRKFIIKNGETEGEIFVETDTGLTIDRKARTAQTDYKSVKQNGEAVGSPEAFLKTIFSPLQLNPIEFMGMSEREQSAILLDLLDYEWDLSKIREWFGEIPQGVDYEQNILSVLYDIQADNGYYYQKRQDINREIRAKKAIITDIGDRLPQDYDGNKWENTNLGELYTKLERIRKENSEIEKAKSIIENHDQKIRKFEADKEIALTALDREIAAEGSNIDTELASLEERIKALKDKKATLSGKKEDKTRAIENEYKANIAAFESEVTEHQEMAKKSPTPVDDLEAEAKYSEEMKSHVGEWQNMLAIQKEVAELTAQSKSLTDKIEKARTLPNKILAEGKLPIEDMSIGADNTILIDGKPISNLSQGEQLDLCLDIGLANVSGLQLILLDGVESLADNLRKKVYERCKAAGVQVIASRTTNEDELKILEI